MGSGAASQGEAGEGRDDLPSPTASLRRAICTLVPELDGVEWVGLRGGRVNRCWRAGSFVVKVYSLEGASPLFPNDPRAEATMLRHLEGAGIAPRLHATGPGWIVYDHVEGRIWREGDDPGEVASLFRKLWTTPPPEGMRALSSGSTALREAACALSDAALPHGLAGFDVPPTQAQLIHGDAVFGNVLSGPSGLRLIDWQCPAVGDPAEDIAAFLSPAMRWLYGGREPDAALEPCFLACLPGDLSDRYRRLKPLFHWRMMQHCDWKRRHGHADYAAALDRERAAFQTC